jgi:hypothetical protein
MTAPKTPAPLAQRRQLTLAFDSTRLRGMSPAERRTAVTILAALLTEAAVQNAGGGDDDC